MSGLSPPPTVLVRASRPALLPKAIGLGSRGSISLGFERHHGFYELVCARFSPDASVELVSRDFGYVDLGRHSSRPPARKERKIALLIFFLMLEDACAKAERGLMEIARGGANSWCHSLYRLSVHHPKEAVGNKWLGAALGLENEFLDDPFSGVLRFIQCRRAGQDFLVHLDCDAFDPSSVVASVWVKGEWDHSPRLRLEILYDLMRQVPRWTPFGSRIDKRHKDSVYNVPQASSPWEDMPLFMRYINAATKVRMVGLNHQVFRRIRSSWMQEHYDVASFDYRSLTEISWAESAADRQKRIATEVAEEVKDEPFSKDLEELTVCIGSPWAHQSWERNTQWKPEPHESSLSFWRAYLAKTARLRPKASIRLFMLDDVSPLCLYLEFPDGSSFLKWAPAMFGAYHPGNPGWNLIWNLGAPAPPHFKEILQAMTELEKRATAVAIKCTPPARGRGLRTRSSRPR